MQSLERSVVKLIFEFFKTNTEEDGLGKPLLEFIVKNSNIHFEGLTVMCKREKSGFYISVTSKCFLLKMDYQKVVKAE